MPFEAQQFDLRNMVIGPKKQTTYGTALLAASSTHRVRFPGDAFAALSAEYRTDLDRAGKGHPWPTERLRTLQQWQFSADLEITDFLAGWLAAFCLSKDTITGAGPYTHTCIPENVTNIAPVTSIYFQDTADVKFKVADLAITEVEFSGTPNGPLHAKLSMLGSGKNVDGADATIDAVALPTNIYLLGSDTDVLVGAVGAAASIKERVRGWSVKVMQGVVLHRAAGGGLLATMTKLGFHRVNVSLQVDAKDVDDMRTLFVNDTLRELQINTNSGAAAQLNFLFKGIYFRPSAAVLDGNQVVWNMTATEEDVQKNGANEMIQIVAINSVANGYMVAG